MRLVLRSHCIMYLLVLMPRHVHEPMLQTGLVVQLFTVPSESSRRTDEEKEESDRKKNSSKACGRDIIIHTLIELGPFKKKRLELLDPKPTEKGTGHTTRPPCTFSMWAIYHLAVFYFTAVPHTATAAQKSHGTLRNSRRPQHIAEVDLGSELDIMGE